MNNKGFTVVELLATFTLTMIIMLFLFEIVLELKNVYVASNIETLSKNENALIASELNRKLYQNYYPGMVGECTETICTLYNSNNGATVNIIFKENMVTIGTKKFEMPEDVTIENPSIVTACPNVESKYNCYVKVSYTLTSSNLKKDIPFNLVLSYNT